MISTKHNFIIVFLIAYFIFNQNIYYSDGNVTAPERNGYFYQIKNYEQYTEYAKKADFAILFFNYDCSYKPCQDAAGFLQDNIKLDDYKNVVKIFEVDLEKFHNISEEYNVGAVPYLISLRNGKEVGRLRTTLASCPKSIKSLFKNLLDGDVIAPELHGYFYQIKSYEQYTAYAKNAVYAVLFFNYKVDHELSKQSANCLQDQKRLFQNSDVKIFELDFEESYGITDEWKVDAAPYLISLRNGKENGRLGPTLSTCSLTIETFFQNLLGGHVTVPKLNGLFYQVQSYEQFTEYTIKEPYAILFFNKSYKDEICIATIQSLKEQMKKPKYKAVKIYEVNIDNIIAKRIKSVEQAPYLLSLRTGTIVEELTPSQIPRPLSLDYFFLYLVAASYFNQIKTYEQYTEYVKNTVYVILFFNYSKVDHEISKQTVKLLQDQKRLINNGDVQVLEVDFEESYGIADEWKVGAAPYLISLRNGKQIERLMPVLAESSNRLVTFFQNLLDGHVTVPKLNGLFYQIQSYEQYTEYILKEPYAILFFNKSYYDDICNATIKSLEEQMKKPNNSAVKIYEVDIDNNIGVKIDYGDMGTVKEAPLLISSRTGTIVDGMLPSKAPWPLSLDSFFSKLVAK